MHIIDHYKDRKNQIKAAVFLITVFIACVPLISRYCINGHDLEYHLLRIESLKEGILIGKPFLKVNTLFFGNAGYASSMFYPDFLLYIPAVLRIFGVSINASYHIFAAVSIILCYLTTYQCVRGMTGSAYGGMIAAVTMSLCQYHLDDIYIRGAVGEYTAFIFVPVVIYAIYNIIYEEADKPGLFILGYAGVLLCHTSTFIMCTAFGAAALLINFKKTIGNIRVLKRLCIYVAATLLLTCFYWLPMLEQFMDTSFYVSTPWMQPKDEAVEFLNIFGAQFPSLGYVCVLMLIPRIFMRKYAVSGRSVDEVKREISEGVLPKQDKEKINVIAYADLLLLAGILFTVITSDLIPWERIGRYVSFIQFPWRFFIMGSALFSVAAGLIYSRLTGNDDEMTEIMTFNKEASTRVINAGAVILAAVLIINGISAFNILKKGVQGYYDYSDDYYSYKPYTANVIAGEWLPSAVNDRDTLIDDSESMTDDEGKAVDFVRNKNAIEADINESFKYVDVPFIYYLGYKATISDGEGKTEILPVTGEGHNGMCRVYLQGHDKGRLRVSYAGTGIVHISSAVSIVTLILLIVLYIRKKRMPVKHE